MDLARREALDDTHGGAAARARPRARRSRWRGRRYGRSGSRPPRLPAGPGDSAAGGGADCGLEEKTRQAPRETGAPDRSIQVDGEAQAEGERAERELIRAKEALEESNRRIVNILDSITDGFVALDKEWRFTFVNRRAEEILQPLHKSRENLLGVSVWDALPDL